MKILSVSPKGQITIPVSERAKLKADKYLLEVDGDILILKPIEIRVFAPRKRSGKTDELHDFSQLAVSSFDFWNNSADDIYQQFYENS